LIAFWVSCDRKNSWQTREVVHAGMPLSSMCLIVNTRFLWVSKRAWLFASTTAEFSVVRSWRCLSWYRTGKREYIFMDGRKGEGTNLSMISEDRGWWGYWKGGSLGCGSVIREMRSPLVVYKGVGEDEDGASDGGMEDWDGAECE